MKIIARKEAQKQGLKRYFTGKPCKNGHVCERTVKGFGCVECRLEIRKRNYEKYSDKQKEYAKQHHLKNKKHNNKLSQEYRKNNPKRTKELCKQFRQKYPEKLRAYTSKRKAKKLQATPLWFEEKEVQELYLQAKLLEEKTGEQYHVDHIIPLQNDVVCGLHCLENLRVIPAKENLTKYNSFKAT